MLVRLSIRARLTLLSTFVVALGLAVGGALLVLALQGWTLRALDESGRHDGQDIADLIDSGQAADPLPTFGSAVAQVVNSAGQVVLATPGGDRLVPLLSPAQTAHVRLGGAVDVSGSALGDSRRYRVVGVPAGTSAAPQTVLVAINLTDQERTFRAVRWAVATGISVLIFALAIATWLLIGSALRPVEALRRGADEITGSSVPRRLPVPDAHDEIRSLAETLNEMLRRLEHAAARQRTFVADAAHELRSPIASLRTQLEVAMAHPAGVDLESAARDALLDVDRMAGLVDDLMLLARLDHRGAVPDSRGFEVVDVCALVMRATESRASDRVSVRTTPGAPGHFVVGDTGSLERALSNLIDNAVRHAATAVQVGADRVDSAIRITVLDDGPGIPEVDRERVFERFTRLDHGRDREHGGSGLGLAIANELITAHGGTIHIEDACPGARVVILLPLAAQPPPQPPAANWDVST